MQPRRVLARAAALVLLGGGAIWAAPSAFAGQPIIWYQAVARASADAPCPATPDADTAAGWTPWAASWEAWPDGGKGGYVCTRSITWAYAADPPSAAPHPSGGCVAINGNAYAQFAGGWWLPNLSGIYPEGCAEPSGGVWTRALVYAPDGPDQARQLCIEAFGSAPGVAQTPREAGAYVCDDRV